MTELNFENASKKLDEIIKELESGNLSLDESVKKFEEAQNLISICEKQFLHEKGKLMVIHGNLEKILNFDGELEDF